jgi:predicted transcriptional regulator
MIQQFYHQSLGFMFASKNVKATVREHYSRVSPGTDVWFVKTELANPDALIVVVGGRDVGHIFGKGIAS